MTRRVPVVTIEHRSDVDRRRQPQLDVRATQVCRSVAALGTRQDASVAASLEAAISAAIAANDPLDPWLVQSNYDGHYWDDEAARLAPLVRSARDAKAVYRAMVHVLRPLIRDPRRDDEVRGRLQAAADATWRWLNDHPDAR